MEVPLRIPNAAEGIAAILHVPASRATVPQTGLLMVHAQGSSKIGHKRSFVELAREIQGQGAPVLRFDLLGEGESEELSEDPYLHWRGLQPVVEYFWSECNLKRIVALGDCFGGLLAAHYSRLEPRIEHTIIWNMAQMKWTADQLQGYTATADSERDSARTLWVKLTMVSWWKDARWSWAQLRNAAAVTMRALSSSIANMHRQPGPQAVPSPLSRPACPGRSAMVTLIHASSQPGASRSISLAEHVFAQLGMQARHVRIPGVPFSPAWKVTAFEEARKIVFCQQAAST